MFKGGFVGVDVFFVISGYLITSIILDEKQNNSFTLLGFYERRARRILPALMVVILVCIVLSWTFSTSYEFKDFSQSLVAISLFASNIFFWMESGYFAPASEQLPLLHTWSLSVEEQFYLFFPLLVISLWFLKTRALLIVVSLIAIVSLLMTEWFGQSHKSAGFYLLHTRAWELLIGSIIAIVFFIRKDKPAPTNDFLAMLGLCMLLYTVFVFDKHTPFPSFYTLVPTIGTALIIYFARSDTITAKLIANRQFVYIGLMSYSLYLWHQPVFAFIRMEVVGHPPQYYFYLAITMVFILAWLSLRYIETPFRNRKKFSRNKIFACSGVAMISTLSFGLLGHINEGFSNRYTSVDEHLIETISPSPKRYSCHTRGANYMKPGQSCTYEGKNVTWAVFGDSHGVEMAHALSLSLKNKGEGVLHLTFSDCPPAFAFNAKNPGCTSWIRESVSYIQSRENIQNVLMAFRHSLYLYGHHESVFPLLPDEDPRTNVITDQVGDAQEARELYWQSFSALISELSNKGKNVYVLYPVPELPVSIKNLVFPTNIFESDPLMDLQKTISIKYYTARNKFILDKLDTFDWSKNIIPLKPADILCDQNYCKAVVGLTSLYFDDDHLSLQGAMLAINHLMKSTDTRVRNVQGFDVQRSENVR